MLALLEAIDDAKCVVRASKVGWPWAVYTFVGIARGFHSVFLGIFIVCLCGYILAVGELEALFSFVG